MDPRCPQWSPVPTSSVPAFMWSLSLSTGSAWDSLLTNRMWQRWWGAVHMIQSCELRLSLSRTGARDSPGALNEVRGHVGEVSLALHWGQLFDLRMTSNWQLAKRWALRCTVMKKWIPPTVWVSFEANTPPVGPPHENAAQPTPWLQPLETQLSHAQSPDP